MRGIPSGLNQRKKGFFCKKYAMINTKNMKSLGLMFKVHLKSLPFFFKKYISATTKSNIKRRQNVSSA